MFFLHSVLSEKGCTLRLRISFFWGGGSGLSQMGGTPPLKGVEGIVLRIIDASLIVIICLYHDHITLTI